jgi:hypothetical protein
LQSDAIADLSNHTSHLHRNLQQKLAPQMKKQQQLLQDIDEKHHQWVQVKEQVDTFTFLLNHETNVAIPCRLEKMERELETMKKMEGDAQARYKQLMQRREETTS